MGNAANGNDGEQTPSARPTDSPPDPQFSTPMRDAYRMWTTAHAAWVAAVIEADGIEVGDTDVENEIRRHAVRAVSETPAITLGDVAAMLHVWWEEYASFVHPDAMPTDPDAFDASDPDCAFVARAWRTASGREGWPREAPEQAEG